LNTRANETEAGHLRGLSDGVKFASNGEHARAFKGLSQHNLVAGLKDMKGKKVVRKENGLG
jgi:hypothetical protein